MSVAKFIKLTLLAMCLISPALPGYAMGALPISVNGAEMPTLAPMIQKTRPAVVNIATRGSEKNC